MTREEAINKLINARYADEFQGDEELTTAHLMAINALEQEPCEDAISRESVYELLAKEDWADTVIGIKDLPSVTPTISKMEQVEDCVARSEALDILDDFEEDVENGKFKTAYAKARERMCELPSVTPSYNSIKSDLKLCEDWKFYYKHGYTQAKRDLLCEDCISRAEALKAIEKEKQGWEGAERYAIDECHTRIADLPSVTPKKPKGKWKRISPAGIYECTNCNQVIMTSDIDCYKYCHGCGVRMEGKE